MRARATALAVAATTALVLPATGQPARPAAQAGGDQFDRYEREADAKAQRRLDAAEARWRLRGPPSYRYRLELSCFCVGGGPEPHNFRVRRGRPVNPPRRWRHVATVPRLFAMIQRGIHGRGGTASATYRKNGSPKEIRVDPIIRAVDDEGYFKIDRFRLLG
jgi:hypothetical protein